MLQVYFCAILPIDKRADLWYNKRLSNFCAARPWSIIAEFRNLNLKPLSKIWFPETAHAPEHLSYRVHTLKHRGDLGEKTRTPNAPYEWKNKPQ